MKALILAGGRGTRLRPITHTKNKHLLPIGGVPMILRVLKDIIDLGIKEVFINVNKGDKEVREFLGNGESWNIKISYIEQEIPNGMMYPILLAKDLLNGEDFVLHAGDNVLSGGLKKYHQAFLKSNSSAHLLVTKVQNPESFGVAIIENGFVTKTVEKPKEFVSDLAVTGVYFYKRDIVKAMENVEPVLLGNSTIPEYYPPLAHQWLIDHGYKITVSECTGWWKDTGKPEDLLAANHLVLSSQSSSIGSSTENTEIEGNVVIGKNCIIKNSRLRGPIFIDDNVTIKNSYIGPYTAISQSVTITECEVENSIIMEGSILNKVSTRIDSSIIGYNSEITRNQSRPHSHSYFVGENCKLKI